MKRLKQINSSTAPKPSPFKRQTVAELRALQRLMSHAVMRPLTRSYRMRSRWSDGRATKNVAAEFIKPNSRLTSFARLEIYNRQYWLRLLDCFYEDFPGLRAVLGQAAFHQLAVAYLVAHPSTRFTLRDLGSKLVAFLESEPYSPRKELALEMGRLEWAHIIAFDNEANTPFSPDDLRGRAAMDIYLRIQPHITILKLAYPLDDYLIGLRENSRLRGEASNAVEDLPVQARGKTLRLPAPRTIQLVVHRHQNIVYYKRVTAGQYAVLRAIEQGSSLAEALESLPGPVNAILVQKWFKNWSALGWFWLSH